MFNLFDIRYLTYTTYTYLYHNTKKFTVQKCLYFQCNNLNEDQICKICLTILKEFNKFYNKVLKAHLSNDNVDFDFLKVEIIDNEYIEKLNNNEHETEENHQNESIINKSEGKQF